LPDEEQLLQLTPNGLLTLVVEAGVDKGAKLLLLLWRTWYVRNNITHGSDKISFDASVVFLQKYWLELCDIRQLQGASDSKGKRPVAESLCLNHAQKCRQEAKWEAPPQDFLKVNVDGAFDGASGIGGIGVVIRDSSGLVQLTAWRFISQSTGAEEMEALACKEGMDLAAKWCRQNIILETDCSTVASMLSVGSGMRSCLKFTIDEAIEAGSKLPQWKIIHMRRESNSVSHELAQLAKRTKDSAVWRFAAPVCVEQIIARECNLFF
jgi:ribonuclease HI